MSQLQSWMVCIQCHAPACMLFDSNRNLPLCSQRRCEEQLIDEINEEIKEAAEASEEK